LDGGGVLGRQLVALAGQRYCGRWEVIVADNGSRDDSVEVARSFEDRMPSLRVLDASARRGQAFARNVGARAATGDALVFVDADDEVAPGYLEAMGAALSRHDFVSAAFDSDALNPGWVSRTRGTHQAEGVQDALGFLPFAGGGGLGIRRAVFDEVGGFDADHWRSGQDVDLCWRVQLAGHPLESAPDAVLRVAFRTTLRQMYRQGRHYGHGEVLLYGKYRRLGMPRSSPKQAVWRWWTLLRRAPRLRSRGEVGNWLRRAGESMGRLEGSIRHRVLYL
jgi:glycosyltransferase involved in cell wall biosynthesis